MVHYYGTGYLPWIRPDVIADVAHLREKIGRVTQAGADALLLFRCSGASEQIGLLTDDLGATGWEREKRGPDDLE